MYCIHSPLKQKSMKKLFTLLFAVGLVTAASAQSADRHRNDSRSNNNSYQSSPYSGNDRGYSNQYSDRDQHNRNSQWNDRRDQNRYDRDRRQAEQQRYEMMRRRNQQQYHDQRRYDNRSSGLALPLLGLLSVIINSR
jgi:hypothetical protein